MTFGELSRTFFAPCTANSFSYVGTLHEINPEASTIALENVVSFGSEGRRGNPAEEVPPSTSVYEYIVFRGSDVKDISIATDDQKDPAPQEPPRVPDDPAILGVSDHNSFLHPLRHSMRAQQTAAQCLGELIK